MVDICDDGKENLDGVEVDPAEIGLTLFYPGGIHPPPVFPPPSNTARDIKLKLSDFKETPLRHILQVKPFR